MKAIASILLVLAIALAGCTASGEEGSASIYVKDAPTDEFDEIHVVFTEVRVHESGAESDEDAEESDGGWMVLFENASGQDIDLLAANGTAAAFLGEADLPAGNYTQIRIIVQSAYGIKDDNRVPITVSSGTLKMVQSFEVQADMETKIIIDYDLDRSLHQQGNGAWRFTPVIGKTTTEIVEDATSGEETANEGEIVEDAAA